MRMNALCTATTVLFLIVPNHLEAQQYRQALLDSVNNCAAQVSESVACYIALVQDSLEIIAFYRDVTWEMELEAFVNPTATQFTKASEFAALDQEEQYRTAFEYFDEMASSGQTLTNLLEAEPVEALSVITVSGPIVYEVFIEAIHYVLEDEHVKPSVRETHELLAKTMAEMMQLFDAEILLLWDMLNVKL